MFDETNIDQLRRSTVVDRDGDKVGKVGQVYLDDNTGRPNWVTVATGMFGTRETFVPLDRATQEGDTLRVPYEKSFIKDAPNLDGEGHLDQSQEAELYRFYGLGDGAADRTDRDVLDRDRDRDVLDRDRDRDVLDRDRDRDVRERDVRDRGSEAATTLHEERVNVDKDRREVGRARLRKYVVTETETVDVPVQREELRVEREPVRGGSARPGGLAAGDREVDETITLHEERPVVKKETVATERVRVGKETVTDKERVTTDVSREEADIDRGGTEARRDRPGGLRSDRDDVDPGDLRR